MKVIDDNGNEVSSYILFTFDENGMDSSTKNASMLNYMFAKERMQANITRAFSEDDKHEKEGNKNE